MFRSVGCPGGVLVEVCIFSGVGMFNFYTNNKRAGAASAGCRVVIATVSNLALTPKTYIPASKSVSCFRHVNFR